ncbi:PorP/SprF family type IX secretion system membrane protein [Lewinella sp. IMCC34191]|uniref:PorP/SprF family type IX secretion system membrane protein n=1 Tax=Lewinella sp. IMCC34191 TaxID=2259172 RepID=UPI000E22A867|nr:PorP/SprF family type IX secretion system membrane protein [Lewinella sp. IMCC34191]
MVLLLRSVFLVVMISAGAQLLGQDPFFSQFYANRVYLNPAYAGLEAGTQLILNYRDQWFGLPDATGMPFQGGYRTYNATLNQRMPCFKDIERATFGIAGSVFQDETGAAPLKTTGVGLAAAFEYAFINPDLKISNGLSRLDMRMGAQLSMMQSSMASGDFIFSYQLDPVTGVVGAAKIIDVATGPYMNMNIGAMVRGSWNHGLQDYTIFTLGASLSNVNQPNVAFDEESANVNLPRRTTLHMGLTRRVSSMKGTRSYTPTSIAPQFRWDSQLGGKFNLYTLGSYLLGKGHYTGIFYQFNTPNRPATNSGDPIGGRNSSTLILSYGIDVRSLLDVGRRWRDRATGWIVGFSYDLPLSGVNASASVGTVEVNCRIMLADLKSKCRILGKNELYKGATCPVSF